MKRKVLAIVLAGLLISNTGCGAESASADTSIPTLEAEDTRGDGNQTKESASREAVKEAEISTETAEQVSQAEAGSTDGVTITTETIEKSSDASKTDRQYDYFYVVPAITIPGNEAAQQKIQADLDAYVQQFLDSLDTMCDGDFGVPVGEDPAAGLGSYVDLTLIVERADDKVISIGWGQEGYNQGAHGWYGITYANYFTQTGEKITFDDLGSGFRDKALELVTAKAAQMQKEENLFFDNYEKCLKLVVLDGTEDMDALYSEIYGDSGSASNGLANPTFGITKDGFFFESGQYVLQPYACGIVDIEIPAADFGDALTADIF